MERVWKLIYAFSWGFFAFMIADRLNMMSKLFQPDYLRYIILGFSLLLLSACATKFEPGGQVVSSTIVSDGYGWASLDNSLPSDKGSSWFNPQPSGPDALNWRLAMIDTASVSIDAQYFLWKEDAVGSLLLERLLQAADRGVEVRLLVDDSFLPGEDMLMSVADRHPNLTMRIFNPFEHRSGNMLLRYVENLNDYRRVNHRMHNKLLIVDGHVAVVGGRNIADEYFGFSRQLNFRDFDLMVAGAVVADIYASFDNYWNSGWAIPVKDVNTKKRGGQSLAELRVELAQKFAILKAWLPAGGELARDWSPQWQQIASEMLPGQAGVLQDDPDFTPGKLPVQAASKILNKLKNG